MRRTTGVVLILLFLAACDEASPPGTGQSAGTLPDQILTDFDVDMSNGEITIARIHASRGVMYRKRDSMIIEELLAVLYNSDGLYSSTLRSDSGLLRDRKKQLLAYGAVNLKTADSLSLTSDSLFWYGDLTVSSSQSQIDTSTDERFMVAISNVHLITRDSVHLWTDTLLWNDIRRTVATDAYVVIVRNQHDTLQGWGLRSDDQLETITIQKSVTGRVQDRPD